MWQVLGTQDHEDSTRETDLILCLNHKGHFYRVIRCPLQFITAGALSELNMSDM